MTTLSSFFTKFSFFLQFFFLLSPQRFSSDSHYHYPTPLDFPSSDHLVALHQHSVHLLSLIKPTKKFSSHAQERTVTSIIIYPLTRLIHEEINIFYRWNSPKRTHKLMCEGRRSTSSIHIPKRILENPKRKKSTRRANPPPILQPTKFNNLTPPPRTEMNWTETMLT
jgi:hypothetical protein